LAGIANALKRARRVRLGFEANGSLEGKNLILDTDLIRYKWVSVDGNFPEYQKLIPTEFTASAHFDTVEAIKAVSSLKVLADSKGYPIDLTIGNGKVVMANTEDKGQAELTADTEGEVKIRVDGGYLTQALKACGGMVEVKLTNAYSPMLFTTNGYELVVMPMLTSESTEQMKRDKEAKEKTEAEAKPTEPTEAEAVTPAEVTEPTEMEAEKAQAVAEAEAITNAKAGKPKRKRSKAKEPVAV
jgi:DNA polymerase-3 subunit beta